VPSTAFLELQRVVRHLADDLATFRRRAIHAEGRVRELEQALAAAQERASGASQRSDREVAIASSDEDARAVVGAVEGDAGARLEALERENATLRQRLDGATERTRQLLDRVRFLRQQQEQETTR
jgi:hypothetical protein